MLLVKKQFFDAIRSGAKTTTLRHWRRPMVRAGSVHSVRGLGALRVDDVRVIEADDVTNADAHADGLANRAELVAVLAELYPPSQRRERKLYKVTFTYLGPADANSCGNPRRPPRRSASTCDG